MMMLQLALLATYWQASGEFVAYIPVANPLKTFTVHSVTNIYYNKSEETKTKLHIEQKEIRSFRGTEMFIGNKVLQTRQKWQPNQI